MIAETDYQEKAFSVSPEGGLSFIEQLQISSCLPCPKTNVPFLIGVNENAHLCLLTNASCKMWDCETCAYRNARIWVAKIINGCNRLGGTWSFLTLTANKNHRKHATIQNIRAGWKKFYNRILAKMGKDSKDLYYAKVYEQHKDGSFHLHVLISVCFGKRWAKDNALECGMGYMADWHIVQNAGQVAGYIAKYTLKNATVARGGVQWPKGLRRIETSHKWPILPKKLATSNVGWIVKFDRNAQLNTAQLYNARGFEIVDKATK